MLCVAGTSRGGAGGSRGRRPPQRSGLEARVHTEQRAHRKKKKKKKKKKTQPKKKKKKKTNSAEH
eukprot:NODE_27217_length_521_cov_3.225888.p4 GENE.NODE_27217_length_521_cov_3.225888~~NODE_27217_length_521_cov_3.225888.p4  ORF type:complete len:65 (-),score=40.08 NODE_27217_length_521_cov_3.225888:74-268(-)